MPKRENITAPESIRICWPQKCKGAGFPPRCPVKVAVENDGKCGALAEAWKGALAGVKDGAVLVLGSGIGGGVIVNGKVHRGYNFTAGEFSFLLTGRDRSIMDAAWMSVGMLGVDLSDLQAEKPGLFPSRMQGM